MASILRLAGGLDRSYNQSVQTVEIHGSKKQIELIVSADEYPDVDIWAARRRAGFFEKVFQAEVTIQWNGQSATLL